jgi:hypothetical protein
MHEVNLKACCYEETTSLNSALELYADGDEASSRKIGKSKDKRGGRYGCGVVEGAKRLR